MPDFGPPQHLIDALCDCSQEAKNNQYTRSQVRTEGNFSTLLTIYLLHSSQGHVRLVTALANMYSRLMGRQLNPMTDVSVIYFLVFEKVALLREGLKNYSTLIVCPPPRKSLVKGERFIRSEGRPE